MDKSDGDMGSKMEAFNARYAEKLDGLKQKKTEAETSTSSGARASAALRTVWPMPPDALPHPMPLPVPSWWGGGGALDVADTAGITTIGGGSFA